MKLQIIFTSNDMLLIDDIQEYVCGDTYFYIQSEEKVQSFLRTAIQSILRVYDDGNKKPVHLRQTPRKKSLCRQPS